MRNFPLVARNDGNISHQLLGGITCHLRLCSNGMVAQCLTLRSGHAIE